MHKRHFLAGAAGTAVALCTGAARAQPVPVLPRNIDPLAQASGEPLFPDGELADNAIGRDFGLFPGPVQPLTIAYDTADGPRTFADLTGKVRLLVLWAEWAPPCLKELPEMAALQKKYGGDHFEILAILTGSPARMDFATARKTVDDAGAAGLPLWVEPNGGHQTLVLAMSSKVLPGMPGGNRPSIPCAVLIDEKGVVRGHLIGLKSAPQPAQPAPPPPKDAGGKDAVIDSITVQREMTPMDKIGPSIWSTPQADAFISALLAGALAQAAPPPAAA